MICPRLQSVRDGTRIRDSGVHVAPYCCPPFVKESELDIWNILSRILKGNFIWNLNKKIPRTHPLCRLWPYHRIVGYIQLFERDREALDIGHTHWGKKKKNRFLGNWWSRRVSQRKFNLASNWNLQQSLLIAQESSWPRGLGEGQKTKVEYSQKELEVAKQLEASHEASDTWKSRQEAGSRSLSSTDQSQPETLGLGRGSNSRWEPGKRMIST